MIRTGTMNFDVTNNLFHLLYVNINWLLLSESTIVQKREINFVLSP